MISDPCVGRRHALPARDFLGPWPLSCVGFHNRRLPHWEPTDAEFFVTWRLHGTLPRFPTGRIPVESAGQAFPQVDRRLDHATSGPLWLKDSRVAQCVSQVLLSGMTDWRLYELIAWVVMANHIHVLMRPIVPLGKALMNVKSASARRRKRDSGASGNAFLAGRVLRSLGEERSGAEFHHPIYSFESGQGQFSG